MGAVMPPEVEDTGAHEHSNGHGVGRLGAIDFPCLPTSNGKINNHHGKKKEISGKLNGIVVDVEEAAAPPRQEGGGGGGAAREEVAKTASAVGQDGSSSSNGEEEEEEEEEGSSKSDQAKVEEAPREIEEGSDEATLEVGPSDISNGDAGLEEAEAVRNLSSAGAGTNSGWEIAGDQSVLGPGPPAAAEEMAAEQKPSVAKELHTYFMIRIPKPADNKGRAEIRMAELRFKEKTEKRDFINAAFHLKKANRHEALDKLRAARERVRACAEATRHKREEIDPLQAALKKLRDTGRLARDKGRDLPASEQELDSRIAYFEYRIQHESIPLREEKQLLRDIKNLRARREEVCANEALHAEFSESLGEREDIQERLKPLIAELEALKADWTIATEKVKAAEAEFEKADEALNQVQAQWTTANRARQDAFEERGGLMRQENIRNDEFYQNKRDIQHVRQLAFKKEKKLVEELCNAQVERVMDMWNNNDEFRASYVKSNERSTLKRLQTLDGRALGPDEEPPLISSDTADVEMRTEVGQSVTRTTSSKEEPRSRTKSAEPSHVPVYAADVQRKERDQESTLSSDRDGQSSSTKAAVDLDALLSGQKEEMEEDLAAAAELKEKRRQQEMAKAREADERKKRSAERLQSKVLARAQKEAERREKEKEKKARKKAAGLSSAIPGTSTAAELGLGEQQEAEPESNVHVQEVPAESKPSARHRKRHVQKSRTFVKTPLPSSSAKKDGILQLTWFWIVAGVIILLGILGLLARFVL